jgi:phage terminase Nu1 subunit (DNA packaging protein)
MPYTDLTIDQQKFIQALRSIWGIQHWRLHIDLADNPGGDKNNPADGWVDHRWDYLTASIQICRTLKPSRGYETIAHELFHVMLAQVAHCIDQTLEQVPEDKREILKKLCWDSIEHTNENFVRSFLAVITPESLIALIDDNLHFKEPQEEYPGPMGEYEHETVPEGQPIEVLP